MPSYLLIFGAAVRPDRTPSGTMLRRVQGAVAAARDVAGARFLCSGGLGASGHVEAEVMRDLLLQAGVAPGAILMEPAGRDTLEQVKLCDALLRAAGDVDEVVPCTSRYHVPRCAVLLRALGWRVRTVPMPGDWGLLPVRKYLWYHLKEVAALPYDLALLLAARRREAG